MIILSRINSNTVGSMTYSFNIHMIKTRHQRLKDGKPRIGNVRSVKSKKPNFYVNKKNNYSAEFVMTIFIKAD